MTNRKIEYWVIPPKADAEFVARMEEVLDTYAQPYDELFPVLCMDEQPVQLLKETREPPEATKTQPRRVDYEYERAGTANIFMFCEPLAGWRQVSVRERRTKIDWALEMAELLQGRYAEAEKVILVMRQPEHPHERSVLRGVRSGNGVVADQPAGISPHAQARQLAQHRGERIECDDTAVCPGAPLRDHRRTPGGDLGLAPAYQRQATRRRLAVSHRRRAHQAEVALP